MLTLFMFALTATVPIPSSTQTSPNAQPALASAPETQNHHPLSPPYYPSSPYIDILSPESQYFSDEDDMAPAPQNSPPALYGTGVDEDYPYVENSSPSPSPAPYVDVEDDSDEFYYSPSEAPSPAELNDTPAADMTLSSQVDAAPPDLPFTYNAEDDSGGITSEVYNEEGCGEVKGKNRAVIGIVMGAVCLVGLGGLVYKRKKTEKRQHQKYLQLSKRSEDEV